MVLSAPLRRREKHRVSNKATSEIKNERGNVVPDDPVASPVLKNTLTAGPMNAAEMASVPMVVTLLAWSRFE